MTTWRYLLFISSSREAEADAYQGLQDELNDLGQQGWDLTAVTDEGDAKIFILKQPDEIIVETHTFASCRIVSADRASYVDVAQG